MLNVDRQKEILNLLLRQGSVKVADLSKKYSVRDETIRRDLKFLAKNWDINIIYGGAYIKTANNLSGIKELNVSTKRNKNYEAKQIIAKKAADLIEENSTIALNSGSTVEFILDYIGNKNIKIVTLSVNVAAKAITLPNAEVFFPSGRIRNSSGMVVGNDVNQFISSFMIEKCFLGASAFCMNRGVMHPVFDEVPHNKALLNISAKKFMVADSSKVDTTSFFEMFSFDDIDGFISDGNLPKDYCDFFAKNKIDIL